MAASARSTPAPRRRWHGVVRVVTGEDIRALIPSPYYGPAFHDQPILALDKVRYVGEPVAAVLAADPHVAEQAAQAIVAEYEELPAVYDEVEARDGAVIVHDELKPAGTFADLKHLAGRRGTNVALDFHLRRGDVDRAFAEAAHVVGHVFRTQQCLHLPFEPQVAIADPAHPGLTIHSATQTPSFVRTEIARLLGWPENRVRVKVAFLGGGFGAKVYIKLEALVAALALLVRRPVKVALTMEEQFYMITKHPTTFRIESAVTADGRIAARRCEVLWNGGAYADIGPRVTQKSGFTAAGPYDIDNVAIDSYELYTNRPPAGALRGFGIPQLVWAYESHTDLIARELGIDPIEFRRRNILRDGRPQATGTAMRDAAIGAVLDALAARMNWSAPFDRGTGPVRRGRGIAIGFKASISPTTSVAIVTVTADGSVALSMNTVDMGQGADTAMALIVAEVLGDAAEEIRVILPDTDVTPYDMGTLGSRSTFHMGHAVRLAATDARAPARRTRGRSRPAAGHQLSGGGDFPQTLRHAGRQRGRHRHLHPELRAAECRRAVGRRDAVLDGRRDRRGGRGRHRDRARPRHPPRQRGGRRHAAQSGGREQPALRRRHHAARLHPAGEDGVRRRAGHQRLARRLQDSRHPRRAADGG